MMHHHILDEVIPQTKHSGSVFTNMSFDAGRLSSIFDNFIEAVVEELSGNISSNI
jgi:hypothetical protein